MGKVRERLDDQDCGLPLALEAMGERWSFMILRAALNGVHHFEDFLSATGIARNILSNRLARLVENGIMQRQQMEDDRRKVLYRLTDKGMDLLPAMLALRQWGKNTGWACHRTRCWSIRAIACRSSRSPSTPTMAGCWPRKTCNGLTGRTSASRVSRAAARRRPICPVGGMTCSARLAGMNRRFVLIAAPLMLALAAATPAKKRKVLPPPPPPPIADYVNVSIVTTLGTIEVELDHKHAPLTVENILRYVDQKRLDNSAFYRAMHLAWGKQPNGLIQGGVQMDPRRTLKPVAHEPTSQTGLSHKAGALSLARNAPGTAMAEFSILLSDLTSLDADPKSADPEAQAGYAVFGKVTSGMDVVRKIWDQPISQTKGEGAMRGQMLEVPVKIVTVRRAPVSVTAPPPPPK